MMLKEMAKELRSQAEALLKAADLMDGLVSTPKNGKAIVASAAKRFQADGRMHTNHSPKKRRSHVAGLKQKGGHYYYPSENTVVAVTALQQAEGGMTRDQLVERGFKLMGLGPMFRRNIIVEKKGVITLGKRGAEIAAHLQAQP